MNITGLDQDTWELIWSDIWPRLGNCNHNSKQIILYNKLTGSAYNATKSHELSHTRDKANELSIVKEVRANFYAFRHHPIGWFKCLWITLTSIDRWKLYIGKVFKK